jgi:hypothetical protein
MEEAKEPLTIEQRIEQLKEQQKQYSEAAIKCTGEQMLKE